MLFFRSLISRPRIFASNPWYGRRLTSLTARLLSIYIKPNEGLVISDVQIPEEKVEIEFVRSSGPGGQHVNKTNTKVQIRFNLEEADWIHQAVKDRIRKLHPNRINKAGEVFVSAQSYREQSMNYDEAITKLQEIIWESAIPEKTRVLNIVETEPSKDERVQRKRRKSNVKSLRQGKFD
jgi:peptidyl-tRNA hydrolase ICT1